MSSHLSHDTVLVLDYGGQYAHLIANRLRRLRVYSEILPPDAPLEDIPGLKGVILSGGPNSVYDPQSPALNLDLPRLGLPVLGLCYGHQLLAHCLGGQVSPGKTKEYGLARLNVLQPEGVFRGLGPEEEVWMSHGDTVSTLPEGFIVLGSTEDCPIAAMGNDDKRIYGVQFHPEVTHTVHGMAMLENFVEICGCRRDWTMENFVEESLRDIRERVGDRSVFLFVSGGVDSTVAFTLLNRALGEDRVTGLYVDNGFMRKDETRLVRESLHRAGFHNLRIVDASERFLSAVKGVVDPQEKRRIIGNTFLDVRDAALSELDLDPEHWMLGQGTLYPDIIESGGTKHAAVIKTHHNRVDVIHELIERGLVLEPLAQLYKDEVRQVGQELGLPRELVQRHPFPGPGLSVRCLCSTGKEDAVPDDVQHRADELAKAFGLRARVLPVKSVGVQGDFRTYAHPAVLIGKADWRLLESASTAMTNAVPEVNRVTYLLRPDELPDLRPKAGTLTRDRLDRLRDADALAMDALKEFGRMDEIFQMPTVLLPLTADGENEAIVLRPLASRDVMTARFAEIPLETAHLIADRILALGTVACVLYDVTHKPPATMEWE
jgi:GMP synthase (glutamine-hydrolysing)